MKIMGTLDVFLSIFVLLLQYFGDLSGQLGGGSRKFANRQVGQPGDGVSFRSVEQLITDAIQERTCWVVEVE